MLTFHYLAGGPVVTPSLEKTTLPFVNKPSPSPDDRHASIAMMSGSESDLSDVPEHQIAAAAPSHSSLSPLPYGNGLPDEESELSDDSDGLMGSDDAEFEIDSQPLEANAPRDLGSSSEDSPRPPKRRTYGGIEDDEDIMNNPELYGIRRSVSYPISISLGAS